jgi:hypothetical protein
MRNETKVERAARLFRAAIIQEGGDIKSAEMTVRKVLVLEGEDGAKAYELAKAGHLMWIADRQATSNVATEERLNE